MSAIVTIDIKLSLADIAATQELEVTQGTSEIPAAVAKQVVQAVIDLELQVQPKKTTTADGHEDGTQPADDGPSKGKYTRKVRAREH